MTSLFLEDFKTKPHKFLISDYLISLEGPDALQYLNSQTTNDIAKIAVGSFQFNCLLDISGKIVSSFILCKKSDKELELLVSENQVDSTLERIEKFHIADDFEIKKEKKYAYLHTLTEYQDSFFLGQYFFENDLIEISNEENSCDLNKDLYDILFGTPNLSGTTEIGQLINNTRLDELAVDYNKGCYLGQETVSKINSRRGAAQKPGLLICDDELAEVAITNGLSKYGKVLSSYIFESKTYIQVALKREFRVNQLTLELENSNAKLVTVFLYPYMSQSSPDLAVEFYDMAIELFQSGNNEQAINYFLKAIDLNPNYEDAFESLGVLYGRLEKFDLAIELMEQLKALNPKCMMALTNLSLYHMKVGDIETAEKYKGDATLLNFQVLGDEAERKRKEEEVEKLRLQERDKREGMFRQVLEIDEEDSMANNGLGEISFEKSEFEQAKDYFSKAIEGNKKYSVAYLGLGKSLIQLKMKDAAKEAFSKGITIATKNGDMMPANEMQRILIKLS